MAKEKNSRNQGHKLEIKVIPPQCLDMPLVEIARLLGDGPLLWPGGAGRGPGIKFVHYDIKKKRGRKPKKPAASMGLATAAARKSQS